MSAWPAIASSIELSTISQIKWCNPVTPVEPIYIPGRLRTGFSPSKTWMSLAPYPWADFPATILDCLISEDFPAFAADCFTGDDLELGPKPLDFTRGKLWRGITLLVFLTIFLADFGTAFLIGFFLLGIIDDVYLTSSSWMRPHSGLT